MKVLFIDDRPNEVYQQAQLSGCAGDHQFIFAGKFTLEDICDTVANCAPDAIAIGHYLEAPFNGTDVINTLREHGYTGYVIANSGDPSLFERDGVKIDGFANRSPARLQQVLEVFA